MSCLLFNFWFHFYDSQYWSKVLAFWLEVWNQNTEESGQLLKNLLKSWIVVGRKVAMPFPKSILNSSNEKSFKGLEKSNQGMFSFWLRNFFKSPIFFKMTTCWFICLLDNLSRCTTFLAPLFSLLTCWLDFRNFCGFSLLKGSSICLTGGRVLRLGAWLLNY